MAVKLDKDDDQKDYLHKDKRASDRFKRFNAERETFLNKCEEYAALTLPRIFPPEWYTQNNQELGNDYQSLGALAVNTLTNKVILALFSPTTPFFRLDASDEFLTKASTLGLSQTALTQMLSKIETNAIKLLEEKALRPLFIESVLNLVITGNVLLILEDDPQVFNLRKYVVKRSNTGKVIEIITREECLLEELDMDIQEYAKNKKMDEKVCLYKWICLQKNGDYKISQWIDDERLPEKYDGKYSEENLPYRALTWSLVSGNHYGTGHVEDNIGDLRGLSATYKALIEGGILAGEIKFLVNPTGLTKVKDLEEAKNGAALPGNQGDITVVQPGNLNGLATLRVNAQDYIQRLSQSFLVQQVRDAERVTAVEIRSQINELETALGGAYSRIAVDFQKPVAIYLLKDMKDLKYKGNLYKPVIITGLDALSRAGDLDNLKAFMADVAQIAQIQNVPQLAQIIKLSQLVLALATGHGIANPTDYIMSEQEQQAAAQAQQQALAAQQQAQEGSGQPQPDPNAVQQ